MDNYSGHNSFLAAEYGKEAGVHPFGLVAHATNIMQPLDVCIMKPFKDHIEEVIKAFQRAYGIAFKMDQFQMPLVVKTALQIMESSYLEISKSFEVTGKRNFVKRYNKFI